MNKHANDWALDAPTPAQLKELFAQIACGRITRSRLQLFLRGENLSNEIVRIWVNYALPIEGLVRTSGFDRVDIINSKSYPTVERAMQQVEMRLFHLKNVNRRDAVERMREEGWEPGEMHDLFSFVMMYPGEVKKYPIVECGSVSLKGDIAYIGDHDGDRDGFIQLCHRSIENGWNHRCRFLGVRRG